MLILRHFHGILVGKDKDNLRFPIFDEQNVRSIIEVASSASMVTITTS